MKFNLRDKPIVILFVKVLIKLRLVNDHTSSPSKKFNADVHDSYSPFHSKAGINLRHSMRNDPDSLPKGMLDAWRDMDHWQQCLLGVAVTGFSLYLYIIGGIRVFMMLVGMITVFALLGFIFIKIMTTNPKQLKVMISKMIMK